MNEQWQHFLRQRQASIDELGRVEFLRHPEADETALCALPDLGLIELRGRDIMTFLQGQSTCDMSKIEASRSGIGAFCNPQGRVITTFRVLRINDAYGLLMAGELVPQVVQRLSRYVLRSDVKLADVSGEWCVLGMIGEGTKSLQISLPTEVNGVTAADGVWVIKIGSLEPRYLVLCEPARAIALWSAGVDEGWCESGSSLWEARDIDDGYARLSAATSEQFVAQMINLDCIGAISFNKGCYTGQEIIARTHYLGKLKRRMYRVECHGREAPRPGSAIYPAGAAEGEQSTGMIVNAVASGEQRYRCLAVLQMEAAESMPLSLHSGCGPTVKILDLPYTFGRAG